MKKNNFKEIAIKAALKAGSYIKRNLDKAKIVHYKGEINIVTDIDKESEEIIVSTIRQSFKDHGFLAEEGKYAMRGSDFTWIIDPIDGTTNFVHSFPFFCVSVALACKNNIITGVVYDPVREELFSAERRKGAFLNNKRIRVSAIKDLNRSLLATGFAYNVRRAKNSNFMNFIKFLKKAQAVRRAGSAALDLCYVAAARFDGFWEFYLKPWDTAAAVLILSEAGGKITKADGSKFGIFDNEIVASNSKIHSQMLKVLSR